MNEASIEDVSLLFNKLVILPIDVAKIDADDQTNKETATVYETNEDSKPVETQVLGEPQSTYGKDKVPPCMIYIPEDKRKEYQADDSSFSKIVKALNLETLLPYICTDLRWSKSLDEIPLIWCLGLDEKEQVFWQNIKHSNLLISPDLDQLKTQEEKKEMYSTLKKFVSSNLRIISKI